ncbi:PIG-L family deacetylase [Microbispora sp. NEAU-D428]|uniref:PIG-L deacetylase family protein n=1 Tax=Microbispora sitophila TaxID=2771537 RepID=UPI0018674548|nr:PIG-L family deacetylase [Microbispora sitophila]MBE3011308.1 PIG-L family deacetylase [Microbispora sitophila]
MINWAKQRLLVVAPHPDDELLGCGGLINLVKRSGGQVFVLFVTVGDTRDYSQAGHSTGSEREREIADVVKHFDLDGHHVALPGSDYHLRLDHLPRQRLIDLLERDSPLSISEVRPSVVLLPEISSYNQDHKAVAHAGITALRPGPRSDRHQPSVVLMYEEVADGWSGESISPRNFHVGIEQADMDQKIEGLRLYTSQWRSHPHTRSEEALRALAAVRGVQCGHELAEAFNCLRFTA